MFTITEKENVHHADLQAVILAGNGNNRMYPLTEEENLPKALLPIANKPMLFYPLNWLENAQIKNIIVIAQQEHGKRIREYINNIYEVSIGTKIDLVLLDEFLGTADALRYVKDKIKRDFMVLSCDLILNMPAYPLINMYRTQHAAMTTLLTEQLRAEHQGESVKSKDEDLDEYIGLSGSRVLFYTAKADLDDNLPFRVSMLRRFPNIHVYSTLRDAHLYIFKRWILDFLSLNKSISSIKNELVPLLTKAQYSKTIFNKADFGQFLSLQTDYFESVRSMSSLPSKHVKENRIVCVASIAPATHFCARANSLWSFSELNRQMIKNETERIGVNTDIHPKTQLGNDAMIGEGSKVGERSSVKRSVIGAHCQVGKNVKIQNSIIMDYVVIEDYVKLEGCIVCSNAKVMEKASLKDCEVAAKYVVEKETQIKNEVFG